jgi:hypothetical protein
MRAVREAWTIVLVTVRCRDELPLFAELRIQLRGAPAWPRTAAIRLFGAGLRAYDESAIPPDLAPVVTRLRAIVLEHFWHHRHSCLTIQFESDEPEPDIRYRYW